MSFTTCVEHRYPRESCLGCKPREVPAETKLRLQLQYAIRGPEDRLPLKTAAQVLDELIAECRGEVE